MPSDLDLCNLALSLIGDGAKVSAISPPDGSVQASLCARFYPLARDTLLERHPWSFATRRQPLALLSEADGRFRYALPADALKPLSLQGNAPFSLENGVIVCKQANAELRYVFAQTDSNAFSPLFSQALAWLLASHLAGALIKGQSGAQQAQQCLAFSERILNEAITADAQSQQVALKHAPSLITARM